MSHEDTQTTPCQPLLTTLLAYSRIELPLFQRYYSWGGADKETAASVYFTRFLANPRASKMLGNILIYSAKRAEFQSDTRAEVYLADGQHRLGTIVLAAVAVQEVLECVTRHTHRGAAKSAHNHLEQHSRALDVLSRSQLQVRLSPGEEPVRLVEFLKENGRKLDELLLQREQIAQDYQQHLTHIRATLGRGDLRTAKTSATQDRNQKYNVLDQEIKRRQNICAWRAFESIRQALRKPDDEDFFDCIDTCRVFLERIKKYEITMNCLVPVKDYAVPLEVLEEVAFEEFANLNNMVYPLNEGELLDSIIQSKAGVGCLSRELLLPGSELRKALAYFGVKDASQVADFAARVLATVQGGTAYQWVRQELYGSATPEVLLHQLGERVLRLKEFLKAVRHASKEISNLYDLLFELMPRPIYAVYLSRVSEQIGPRPADSTLRAVFKLLALFELSTLYIPSNNKRPHLLRDIGPLKTIEEGMEYVLKHFEARDNANTGATRLDDLNAKVKHLLCKFPLGGHMYRKHAKLVLVLADLERPLAGLAHNWSNYSFEHFVPQKYKKRAPLDTDDDDYLALVNEFMNLDADEADEAINLLGNGALLCGSTNSGLSNKWPKEKVNKTQTDGLENSWWNTHWADLSDNGGRFGKSHIQERTQRLAANATRWLFTHDLYTVHTSLAGAVASNS